MDMSWSYGFTVFPRSYTSIKNCIVFKALVCPPRFTHEYFTVMDSLFLTACNASLKGTASARLGMVCLEPGCRLKPAQIHQ